MHDDRKSLNMEAKRAAAAKAIELVADGMTVGLGSGSTSSLAIQYLGKKLKAGLKIRAVASSLKSEILAKQHGIEVIDPADADGIDITLDGADEADKNGNLIKGGGCSLLREKIIAYASKRFHVMIDESKIVERLGMFPLPVEIVTFAADLTIKQIKALGCEVLLRTSKESAFVTDNGHYICDCKFTEIADPAWLDVKLKLIPGVVETGIFSSQIVTSIIIGYRGGNAIEIAVNP